MSIFPGDIFNGRKIFGPVLGLCLSIEYYIENEKKRTEYASRFNAVFNATQCTIESSINIKEGVADTPLIPQGKIAKSSTMPLVPFLNFLLALIISATFL
jgi:hypothetical protein